jgi:carbonic anhydrase
MMYDRRSFLVSAAAGLAAAASSPAAATAAAASSSYTPQSALAELAAGNARYVAGKSVCGPLTARRLEVAEAQHPFAIVLYCSDSRVAAETIFDQIPGNVFGVRVAGNFVDRGGLGSIEYGVAALKAPLVLVVGHSQCGAVKAAQAFVKNGDTQPGEIQYLVDEIAPGIKGAATLDAAVAANVNVAMRDVRTKSKIVDDAVTSGALAIAGGVYDLHSGAVTMLS